MEPPDKIPTYQEEEISIKDLILKINLWVRFLVSRWKVILISGVLFGALGIGYAYIKKTAYTAEITFVLEDVKSSTGLSAYAGIASQFGIDLGGMGESGIFSGDNILEFLKSRLIVEKSLLTAPQNGPSAISLAELYIQSYDLRKKWDKKPTLANIKFPPTTDRSTFSRQQDSLLNEIYLDVIKHRLSIKKPDKKLAFILVSCTVTNEVFAKEFVQRLVKEAADFYITTKTKRSKLNIDNLQKKADSIELLLNKRTYSAAASQDLNQNPARRVAMVETEVVSRDKMVLQTILGEVIKNLEIAKMAMAQQSPIIQVVDAPIYPLKKEKTGKLKALVVGALLGSIIACIALIIRKIYSAIMA